MDLVIDLREFVQGFMNFFELKGNFCVISNFHVKMDIKITKILIIFYPNKKIPNFLFIIPKKASSKAFLPKKFFNLKLYKALL